MSSDKRDQNGKRQFKCSICGRTFTCPRAYRRHTWIHQFTLDLRRLYQCDICESEYTRHDNLTTHMRTKHGSSLVACNICGNTFSSPSDRRKHMREHQLNLYLRRPPHYDIIGEEFTQKGHVSGHVPRKHGSSLVGFDICGNNSMDQGYLRSHNRPNHFPSYSHRCSICEKGYTTLHELEVHSLTHISNPNENNQFECKTCKKSFTRASELKMHSMICMLA